MTDTPTRFENALHRIINVSESLRSKTKLDPQTSNTGCRSPISSQPLSIDFPPPPNILPSLRSKGVSEQAAKKLTDIFNSKCHILQSLLRNKLHDIQSHSSLPIHHLLSSYAQKTYQEDILRFEDELHRVAALHLDKLQADQVKPAAKTSFNADFVPFLEKYFEFNAYPSAADRSLMARKSMMTPRQIEVWFQNHRNRARKEGKCLPRLRLAEELPKDLCLETLEERMSGYIASETDKFSSDGSEVENNDSLNQGDELAIASEKKSLSANLLEPPYTIPPPYVTPRTSFLHASVPECISVLSGAPLPWPRSPSISPTSPSKLRPLTQSQLDEFSDLFARLTVRDRSKKAVRGRATPLPLNHRHISDCAATCATTTVLCRGRHPSFVSTPNTPSSSLFAPLPLRERSSPDMEVRSPSVGPLDTASPSSKRRKSPQLPRRVPGSSPSSHIRVQHMHHPYASPSRASSSSSSCRTPSSSSESLSTPRTPDNFNTLLPSQTSMTKSTSTPSYSPWTSCFNLPHLGSPSPSPFQSNPSWFPQDLFLHNSYGVSALC
uniref:HD2 homeodomain mating-type protein n=1 Tax=Pleurotus djamor TaxID=34470 RepID=Q68SS9_PLEDJ|nr:HD2 homeodomain mating-type protein [Pleurotus djamor]